MSPDLACGLRKGLEKRRVFPRLERAVEQVAGFERALGIHDLARFTTTG